ncbi:MAG: sigma-70 family RNA polymerase sigma factor, partial [Planctomycetaceae bacterium]|nr:sigma-70 family RNA polymerase sigma factor [Planctomycetaceae bacterium]
HSDMYGAIPDDIDDDKLAESEASELLRKVIESVRQDFHESTFEVFQRRAFDGQDYQQISQELSMKPSTTREAYRRVLSRVREECLELVGQGYWPFDVSES